MGILQARIFKQEDGSFAVLCKARVATGLPPVYHANVDKAGVAAAIKEVAEAEKRELEKLRAPQGQN